MFCIKIFYINHSNLIFIQRMHTSLVSVSERRSEGRRGGCTLGAGTRSGCEQGTGGPGAPHAPSASRGGTVTRWGCHRAEVVAVVVVARAVLGFSAG